MFSSPFSTEKEISIPANTDIVFVSDLFSSDHLGGAELTTDAIIDSSPRNVFRLHSKDVSEKLLESGLNVFWVFGNFSNLNFDLLPTIIANMNYSILEYDYKYCKYRSPEKHVLAENTECDCHQQMHGKIISAFYYAAKSLWWMSHAQMEIYHIMFPFLKTIRNEVLSSVFGEEFFTTVANLVDEARDKNREKWIVIGSTSWIKGTESTTNYCKENDIDFEVVYNLSHLEMLQKFSTAKGLVFLPLGADTCPRVTIEAKLLGCDLILNENVQHAKEEWFATDDTSITLGHLFTARERFWNTIDRHITEIPTLSGYTTTYNCISQEYPFESSILSMLDFCDQVVVVDGGSTDGTWESLEKLSDRFDSLIVHRQERDWDHKRFAVFDGLQKALARSLCTGEFCWQQDSDEVIHENDYDKIKTLLTQIPKSMDLLALPVIEFWGSEKKVRADVNPWKWRLSRNRPHITHGIPGNLRKFDEAGTLYASPGTDGCDYIRCDSFEPIQFASFYTQDAHKLRVDGLLGDESSLSQYEEWFKVVLNQLPVVYHYSWFDISRKIKTYKHYWSKHWQSLYDISQEDTPENNMFFDSSWSDVNNEDIDLLASKLENELGGWIFHSKVDFSKPTPSLQIQVDHPLHIKDWINKK
jgi:glycosyltransferase involved in cell wall biosynthesis